MAQDPKFVRLHNRLANGSHTDLASGFGISGMDIQPFPDDEEPLAQAHVRAGLRTGLYEEASDDEVNAFHGLEADYLARTNVEVTPLQLAGTFQEGQVQGHAAGDRREVMQSRGLAPLSGKMREDADQKRRDALLAAQKAQEAPEAPAAAAEGADGPSGAPVTPTSSPDTLNADEAAAAAAQAEAEAAAAKEQAKSGSSKKS